MSHVSEHAGDSLTIQRVQPQLGRELNVRSPAIGQDQRIDPVFSAGGDNISPVLSWTAVPEAESFAVVVEDPDAPGDSPFIHWLIWDIPGTANGLPQGVELGAQPGSLQGATQGVNDAKTQGWYGPKPPPGHGVHHYHFQVFALSTKLNLSPNAGLPELLNALKGTTLAAGEVVGTFETPDTLTV